MTKITKPEPEQPQVPQTENKNPNPTDSSSDLSEFLKTVNTDQVVLPRNTSLTDSQAKESLNAFAEQQKLNINQATIAVALLFQSGGTAKSCDGNLSVTIFDQTIKLAYLRKALTTAKCKSSERKLARFMSSDIAKIAQVYQLPGNLSKKIIRNHPNRTFTMEEKVWLSDFQVDNESCPEILRNFISETFNQRKQTANPVNSNSKNSPPTTKPK